MIDEKKVRGTYPAGSSYRVGDAFEVQNLFPSNGVIGQIDPYLLLDYMKPVQIEPGQAPRAVGEHGHRGYETVTIVYQGYLRARDSTGNSVSLGPGDVQWLHAASGMQHDQSYDPEFAEQGGPLELVQFWVNVPEDKKAMASGSHLLLKEQIPVTTLSQAGYVRVIAGDLSGVDGPAQTQSPLGVFDLHLNAGHDTELCLCDDHNAALILLRGSLLINGSTELEGEATMALLERQGSMVTLAARQDSTLLILSGKPVVKGEWKSADPAPKTREEILKAIEAVVGPVNTAS